MINSNHKEVHVMLSRLTELFNPPQTLNPTIITANSILDVAFKNANPVTHLKLQKLMYFVYKKYLHDTNKPLFSEYFEVWTYGPVLPSIYHEFKHYEKRPITDYVYSDFEESKKSICCQ